MKLRRTPSDTVDTDAAIAALNRRVHPPKPEPGVVDIDAAVAAALDRRERDRRAERARRDLAARTSATPCAYCSTVELDPDRGFTPGDHGPICPSCVWQVQDRRFASPDGRRDHVAGWLLGMDQSAPHGLGARLGITFAYEHPEFAGGRGPWRHLDLAALKQRAEELGCDTSRWLTLAW